MLIYRYMDKYYQDLNDLFNAHFNEYDFEEYLDNSYIASTLLKEFQNDNIDVNYTVNRLRKEFKDEVLDDPEKWDIEVIEVN